MTPRLMLVGVAAPLAIGAGGFVVSLRVLPTLPYPIAIHWGRSGAADGFGGPWMVLWILPVAVLAYSAFAYVVARSQQLGFTLNQRLILATGPFLATVLSVTIASSLAIQASLEDARDAPTIVPWMGIGFGLGLLVGVLAWFALPRHTPAAFDVGEEIAALELRETERATWTRAIDPTRSHAVGLGIVLLTLLIGGVLVWLTSSLASFLIFLAVVVVELLLVVSMLFWRVTVDSAGFRARSALGLPAFTVELKDIDHANVITVDPLRDFGGWGVRWAGRGRVGIVTRHGEALEVRRKNGSSVAITVGGARTAAALLNTFVQRIQ